jgi:hypothetical protein
MEDRYDISVDIGDGKDYSVATLFENGEYRPIAVCDSISFADSVQRSGYVGVEAGELSFSAEIVDTNAQVIDAFFFNKKMKTFEERCDEAYANKDINALVGIMFTNRLLAFNGLASNIKTLNREFNYAATLWKKLCEAMFPIVGKQRKTTYKTIRRDCAKRNRHK